MVSNLPSSVTAIAVTAGCSRIRCWVAVVAPSQ
jgi:hypothetical protein